MAQLVKGVLKQTLHRVFLLKCDRCSLEVDMLPGAIQGWVGCVRIEGLLAGTYPGSVPPVTEGASVPIETPDALHVCPKCWADIENFAKAGVISQHEPMARERDIVEQCQVWHAPELRTFPLGKDLICRPCAEKLLP